LLAGKGRVAAHGIRTPSPKQTRTGNRITALRWARLLKTLDNRVQIETAFTGQTCDLLVALHARKSHESVSTFRKTFPQKPVILALTGTDLYGDIHTHANAQESLELADRLVLSSKSEGGANVISEAVMASVPVIASRIPGTVGLLGENYPGYFEFGDTDFFTKAAFAG
jgi:glycosyltransferase involved in cell wall biosynthesis